MANQNRCDQMIAKNCTGPDPRPLESVDILDLVEGGSKGGGTAPAFGPGNSAAKKVAAWPQPKERN